MCRRGIHDGLMLKHIDIAKRRLAVPCVELGIPARGSMTSPIVIGRCVATSLDLPAGSMTGQIGVTGDTFPFTRVVEGWSRRFM